MPAATESVWFERAFDRGIQGPEQGDDVALDREDGALGPSSQREQHDGDEAEEDQPHHVARRAPVADDVVETEYLDRSGLGGPADRRGWAHQQTVTDPVHAICEHDIRFAIVTVMVAPLSGEKILITGATGQVANPVAKALAADNEVWAVARFGNAAARKDLEDAGVHSAVVDLAAGDYAGVSDDVTYGLHFARASVGEWGADLDTNVGGLASLMEFCQNAKAFLHCSSTAVYQPNGNTPRFKEDDPLGDNHRVYESFLPDMQTYSITKIAAEGAARSAARRFELPTTIARLNVPYGRRVQLARLPSRHDDGRPAGAGVRRGAIRVQPDSRRRHPRDDSRPARRRVGARDHGELGRERCRQHSGVVRVPG